VSRTLTGFVTIGHLLHRRLLASQLSPHYKLMAPGIEKTTQCSFLGLVADSDIEVLILGWR
jgi:hypothetical protein